MLALFAAIAWGELDRDAITSLLIGFVLLAWFIPGLLQAYRGKSKQSLRDISIWFGIVVVLIVGYAFRPELLAIKDRVMGTVFPGSAIDKGNGTIVIAKNSDANHFIVDGSVNGKDVRFVLDTGASDVVLTHETAQRLGLSVRDGDFTMTVSTANGLTRVAPIRLDELRIASIALKDVEASVTRKGELDTNLLGMSFLSRLSGYAVEGDRLTLRQ